jgi:hypothetical protein
MTRIPPFYPAARLQHAPRMQQNDRDQDLVAGITQIGVLNWPEVNKSV